MSPENHNDVDVIVVGAGPTGLTVAGDLAASGVRTLIIERRTEESGLTRAFGVHARTLEALDARGLAEELVAQGAQVTALQLFERVHVDLSKLKSRFPYLLITPQYNVEQLLRRRAQSEGAKFLTGTAVAGLTQDEDSVKVHLSDGRSLAAKYVVGADGVHSAVRDAIGQPFPGTSVIDSIMLADVRLAETPANVLAVNAVGDCFAFVAPFGDGWYRIFAWDRKNQQPESAPLEFEEIRAVTKRALGTDFGMHDPRWTSRFHSDERQVPHYRFGRVFLAGDAAHVHSPAGGQGMNTGIQDAVNLGWKLAAVVNGSATEALLDTYQDERHPVGRLVLRSSGAIIRMAMVEGRFRQAARNRVMSTLLKLPPAAHKATGTLSGVGIKYPAPSGSHPLVGRRAEDFDLIGEPNRLYEALRGGTFVLVTSPENVQAVSAHQDSVVAVVAASPRVPHLLVRPDGYIAWASNRRQPRDLDAVLQRRGARTQRAS